MRGPRSLVRRHWLTGVFVFSIVGLVAYSGQYLYRTEVRLREIRTTRMQLEAQLAEEMRRNQMLQARLAEITSDAYMEVLAKEMGYVYPGETVYQPGNSTSR
ncbi:MAG TPA: septum formation initiator family protein [Symbiobacteriaceae bacterium]